MRARTSVCAASVNWPATEGARSFAIRQLGTSNAGMRGSPYSAYDDPDELRKSGMYEIVPPDEAVGLIRERGGASFKPLMGGLSPEVGWECLRLFESQVLPKLS